MSRDAIGSVTAALFGLDGFEVLAAADAGGELELMIETTADLVGCPECGAVATAKDRRPTWVADLPLAGRPVVQCWVKRVWECRHQLCPKRTWTERHEAIPPRAVLSARAAAAGVDAVRTGATVARQACGFGVSWHTHHLVDADPRAPRGPPTPHIARTIRCRATAIAGLLVSSRRTGARRCPT